jgi:hypothetical protein
MTTRYIRAIVPVCPTCAHTHNTDVRATTETGDESVPFACYFCNEPCTDYASVRVPDPADMSYIADEFNLLFLAVGIVLGVLAVWN